MHVHPVHPPAYAPAGYPILFTKNPHGTTKVVGANFEQSTAKYIIFSASFRSHLPSDRMYRDMVLDCSTVHSLYVCIFLLIVSLEPARGPCQTQVL